MWHAAAVAVDAMVAVDVMVAAADFMADFMVAPSDVAAAEAAVAEAAVAAVAAAFLSAAVVAVVSEAAAYRGASAVFADPRRAFAGGRACQYAFIYPDE